MNLLRLAFLSCLTFASATVAATPATKPATDARPDAGVARIDPARLDASLRRFVDAGEIVGASALVWHDGREAYFGAFGMADREAGKPMARDTIVRIFSMTKPVTGVALMQLYEQGRFQLDDPVSRYLPEFARVRVYAGTDAQGRPLLVAPERPITIRDLMRHTAGFVGGNDAPGPVGAMYRKADPENFDNTLAEEVRRIASVPLLYQPGTRWLYSPAVDVQARLVEVFSGQPFDAYLQAHVFEPLGMKDTRYVVRAADRDRFAALYLRSDDGVSTVRLMATDALPRAVGPHDRSWLPSKGQVGFGIDFAVRIAPPADAGEASGEVGEFFWDGAANTLFWVDPVNDLAAVLFAQWLPFGKVPLHKAFRDAVYHDDTSAAAPRD
ncbi:serine hydrolase domain-containing protein [Pseudoxanthomonas sp. J35]|uniref:serine hydrolase domain-containing protein n=1 Tax=Pseudoxanthomonas sp. J35 TaxID=935852 RepID=UPI00048FB2B7|nr:serine hydrolase domain-containing protein [Pseudoxanthomonas sp. J35]